MPKVALEPDGLVVEAAVGEPILTALHRHGLYPRSGCRRGGCGLCKADVLSGHVEHGPGTALTALSPEETAAGVCLPCRATAPADCVIQLRGGAPRRGFGSAAPSRTAQH